MKYKHIITYTITLLLILGGALTVSAKAKGQDARNRSHLNVKVGFYNIPGYHNLTEKGERSGYGYDFIQLLRRHSTMDFTYIGYEKSWAESLAMLDAGEVDILTGALRTPERARKYGYSYPIGTTMLNLYVRNKDVRYRPDDYRTYNGMRIGTVKSEILDQRIQRMATRNGFACTIVDFDNFDSMCKALDEKKVDAICAIGTHLISGYRILESFDNENIYAIVRKDDTELLQQIDDGIMEIDQAMAMWQLQLFRSNYLVDNTQPLDFTDKELAYIRRHNTAATAVKVATDDNWHPYSWYDNSKYHGISVEIMETMMQKVGIKYEFVRGSISSEQVLKDMPEVDVYICFAGTEQNGEEQGLIVSPSYLQPSIAIISKKRYDQIRVLGLAQNTPMLNKATRKRFTGYSFVTYINYDELQSAVEHGDVDGAILYDYVAQAYVNMSEQSNLQITFVPGMTLPLHMVTRMDDDRELITILSKCINTMNTYDRNNIATKYLSTTEREKSLWEYMKDHPWIPLLVLLIFGSCFSFEKFQRMRIVQRKDAQARRIAEEANAAKTSFLFNMSHDIRTPMNAIMGFRDLLEKNQYDEDKRADYLRKIEDASVVLLSIINNVLEMARIEKGAIELDETAWSTYQYRDTIYSMFADQMEKKGLEFKCELSVEHPYIYCDPTKLREVFFNLLSNAYKYTPKGSVHMFVEEVPCNREGWANYKTTITDTGMGMSKEFLPHLFEEFSREKNSTETKIEGTGLGMPIVKRLIELMGGTIEVQSQRGVGTTFTIVIPHRLADREKLVDHSGVVVDPKLFEGKRILLAEDNELNAEIAMEILCEKGFIVELAENGSICCDMLRDAPEGYYDLILMDIQMPEMNGYDATRKIRRMSDSRKANIPILAMTANAFEEDKREAMRAGMNGHLSKPINITELIKGLARTING